MSYERGVVRELGEAEEWYQECWIPDPDDPAEREWGVEREGIFHEEMSRYAAEVDAREEGQ